MGKPLLQWGGDFALIQGALALVLGLLTYIEPGLMRWAWPSQPELVERYSAVVRVIGAVAIAAGLAGLAVWRTKDWEKSRLVALFFIVFYLLAGIALILTQALGAAQFTPAQTPTIWLYGVLSLLLGIGWLYLWRAEEGGFRLGL